LISINVSSGSQLTLKKLLYGSILFRISRFLSGAMHLTSSADRVVSTWNDLMNVCGYSSSMSLMSDLHYSQSFDVLSLLTIFWLSLWMVCGETESTTDTLDGSRWISSSNAWSGRVEIWECTGITVGGRKKFCICSILCLDWVDVESSRCMCWPIVRALYLIYLWLRIASWIFFFDAVTFSAAAIVFDDPVLALCLLICFPTDFTNLACLLKRLSNCSEYIRGSSISFATLGSVTW
jgi:hypothetical protein